jgi:hypothetical protein
MRPTRSKTLMAFDTDGLGIINAKSNVAFDVFLDTDIEKAVNTTAPAYGAWCGISIDV